MPPKRDADVFDDAIAPGTDSASAVASVTRGGKKKRSQTVKAVDDGQVGGSDTENVAPPGAPVTPQRPLIVGVLESHNGDPDTSAESDTNKADGDGTHADASLTPGGSAGPPAELPDFSMVDYRSLAWYPVTLDRRLRAMLTYQKPSDGIFSLSRFPEKDVAWGQSDTSINKLCLRGSSVPIVIWVVGSVTSVWFYDQNGNPHNKVSMGVAPLTANAMSKGRRILSHFACPPQNIESWNTHISASRWQTMRIPRRRDVAVIPFDRCYNATTCFESKTKMPTLPIEDIKVNDLVLIEVNVGRYSTSKDPSRDVANSHQRLAYNKDKFRPRTSFAEWKPTFDLLSVSLLCAAPDDPAEAGMEEAPDADVSL